MSAYAIIYNRKSSPGDIHEAQQLLDSMSHREVDGRRVAAAGPFALGHLQFWTTPEDMGQRQPLYDDTGRYVILFDGRLDNRPELLTALSVPANSWPAMPDQAVVLSAYSQWGEKSFSRLIGPFSFFILDTYTSSFVCVRDALGDRTAYYHIGEAVMVIASEPAAVVSHPGVSNGLDDEFFTMLFAGSILGNGRTCFREVREILPGHFLKGTGERIRLDRYWQPGVDRSFIHGSDQDYSEHYRYLLTEVIKEQLRSISQPAVLMSGGLDSTSVASLIALEFREKRIRSRLKTFSYVFDEYPTCDERVYIREMSDRYGIEPTFIHSDNLWPLRDWNRWPDNPNTPEFNIYRNIKEAVYQEIAKQGIHVLFTGGFGDQLYTGGESWLADRLRGRRLRDSLSSARFLFREYGFLGSLHSPEFHALAAHFLDWLPGGRRIRPKKLADPPSWLTPYAANVFRDLFLQSFSVPKAFRSAQFTNTCGAESALSASLEIFYTSRYKIELREPYRDRRVVEFLLSVPADQLYRQGIRKFILRQSMQGVLPDQIRMRRQSTTLLPLLDKGLLEGESETITRKLDGGPDFWSKFVQPEKVRSGNWVNFVQTPSSGLAALIPFFCLSAGRWAEKISARSSYHR